MIVRIDSLKLEFENQCEVAILDRWAYYRNRFIKLGSNLQIPCSKCGAQIVCKSCGKRKIMGMKAVDVVMMDGSGTVWLLEAKDYRRYTRTNTVDLADEVAIKVRDSLAILLAASTNADNSVERNFAVRAAHCTSLRIALHLEQPSRHSKLFPQPINLANLQLRIRNFLYSIDPHPKMFNSFNFPPKLWRVI